MKPIHSISFPRGPRLCVSDLDSAEACHGGYDVVISILSPGTSLAWSHPRHHLFWVADRETMGGGGPDAAFVDGLLGVDLAGASAVLIQRHAGFSRSPAAAMILAKRLGASLKAIERGIDWQQANPNRLILALGEARLGSGHSLQALAERKTGRSNPWGSQALPDDGRDPDAMDENLPSNVVQGPWRGAGEGKASSEAMPRDSRLVLD